MRGADRQQCAKANWSQTAECCFHGQKVDGGKLTLLKRVLERLQI